MNINDLINVVDIATKISKNGINSLTPQDIQKGINTYRNIKATPLGIASSIILKNTPIGKPVREAYKENVPMNFRMLARGVENTAPYTKVKPWTEKDMTPKEIGQARAIVNDSKKYPAINRSKGIVEPNRFNYFNYDPENYKFFLNRERQKRLSDFVDRSFNNPNYAFMQAIGSGDIVYDKNRDAHILDTYDFSVYGDAGKSTYGAIHKLAEDNTKKYNVNINTMNRSNPNMVVTPHYNYYMPDLDSDEFTGVTKDQIYNEFLRMYTR